MLALLTRTLHPRHLPRSFLDGLTARAGLAQLSDTFVSDPHLFFKEGQSVRAVVVQVGRASLVGAAGEGSTRWVKEPERRAASARPS